MDYYPYLSQIVDPRFLHTLPTSELQKVADEVRRAIIANVSQTGGHLSSNLGTVELTVALYAAYSLPPDKVVWDTGHQAYPHKLLTGRLPRFDTLRKHKGLSGFLKPEEHELDAFGAGHAGTAISAALGFAAARDIAGTDEKIVAVTGDSAICSGMSWEALNHAGELGTQLLVVLNDNRMSIAPNVGALTQYFTRLRSRPDLQDIAGKAKTLVERFGGPVERVAAGLRHGLTHYFAPEEAGTIFEEMGFEYLGPIDGHNIEVMVEIFRNTRQLNQPVFVHAITTKGKGYGVAEEDSRKWHGVAPFNPETSEIPKSAPVVTFTQAFGDAMCACAEADPKVVAITAAMPDGTGLTKFAQQFPERYFDTGIAEQHAVTFAAGLAAGGQKPFCVIYSTFLQRGFDQVLHDVCIQKLPVRFLMDRSGLVGDDGPTHHGVFDISMLSFIPNMVLLAPRDTTELREMTFWMLSYQSGPTAIRYPRGSADDSLPEARSPIALGKAEVIRSGKHLTLCAVGSMVGPADQAARELSREGIEASVINARFTKPIDFETIFADAERTGHLILIEEGSRIGGFGQQVRDEMVERGSTGIKTQIIAIPDSFVEHGTQPIIRGELGLDAQGIIAKARTLVESGLR